MDKIVYEHKEVSVSVGYTEKSRKEKLNKLKLKMEKDGWELEDYFDGGLTKTSKAKFKRDIKYISEIKENKFSFKNIMIGFFILIILGAIFGDDKSSPNDEQKLYQEYENKTNLEMQSLTTLLKDIAYSFSDDNNISETYKDTMYDCLGYMVYAKNKDFKLSKMMQWCKDDYINKDAKAIYYNEAWLLEDFSAWDGSYPALENIIKDSMNDKSSYEHSETRYRMVFFGTKRPHMYISTEFRGKNAYGGIVKQSISVKVDAKTKALFDLK